MANHEKHIDDLLRDALGDHTEMPPAGAWADMENRLANTGGAEHIDDVLQDALGDYTEVPPATAWADMEKRLDQKERRRRPFAWFWYAAAVTGVLLVAYMFIDNRERDTAFRGKGTPEQVAMPSAAQTNNTTDNISTATQPENGVNEPQSISGAEELNKEATRREAATAAIVETAPGQRKELTATPKQTQKQNSAPVAKEETPQQKVKDTLKKEQKIANQIPVPQGHKEVVGQQEETTEVVDDIAHAIRKRGPGTVMNVIRSRYADSMAKVEKELARLAEERKAKEEAKEEAKRTQPAVAAAPKTPVETVKEESKAPVAGIDPMAKSAIDKTENNLLVKQDAIPGSGIKQPVDALRFEDSDAFIGPRQDPNTYAGTLAGDVSLPGEFVRVRTPLSFDLFMKLGLETGTSQYKANKYVFAPMLQANISDRFSLIFQPAVKFGNVNFTRIGKNETYRSIESSYMDSIKSFTTEASAQGIISEYIKATYYYQESYDSTIINRRLSSPRVVEADLPLMLNYKLAKGWSVYGGPVMSYSNRLQVEETVNTYKAETLRDTINYYGPLNSKAPTATPIREVFPFTGRDSNSVNINSPYMVYPENKVRFGYMLGISYNYKRWSADLSVQQNLSRLNYIPNVSVRNIYLQPYTRFMIGYRLNNKKK